MRRRVLSLRLFLGGAICALMAMSIGVNGKEVSPMLGGVIIDGYDFKNDIGPKGSIAFDKDKGEFVGYYNALKMPAGRRAIFAWVHDTVNQRSEYLGPVGWLKKDTGLYSARLSRRSCWKAVWC